MPKLAKRFLPFLLGLSVLSVGSVAAAPPAGAFVDVINEMARRAQTARTCKSGFVWRVARPSDLVCVTPAERDAVQRQNAAARSRVQPGGGAYGPNTCRPGYVWREAYPGDLVCVTPSERTKARQQNQLHSSRVL